MPQIFISYSNDARDRLNVASIRRALEASKIPFWDEQEIAAGGNWLEELESAMDRASVIVLCISPEYLASEWAMFELGLAISRARESGATIVPVILRGSEIPDIIRRFQFLDARSVEPAVIAEEIRRIAQSASEKQISDRGIGARPSPAPGGL